MVLADRRDRLDGVSRHAGAGNRTKVLGNGQYTLLTTEPSLQPLSAFTWVQVATLACKALNVLPAGHLTGSYINGPLKTALVACRRVLTRNSLNSLLSVTLLISIVKVK